MGAVEVRQRLRAAANRATHGRPQKWWRWPFQSRLMAWASAVDTRHVADEVGGSFERLDSRRAPVQVDRVGDVAKLGSAEVADHCPEALGGRGDLARHEQLAGLGLPSHAGSQVHRGSVVVAFEGDGTPVVGAGTGEEYGLWCRDLSLDELLECDHCASRCRKSEHDGVADRLDELVVGTEHLLVRAWNAWMIATASRSPWASVTAVKPARSTKANVASRSGADTLGLRRRSAGREELGEILGDRHGLGGRNVRSAGVAERVAADGASRARRRGGGRAGRATSRRSRWRIP